MCSDRVPVGGRPRPFGLAAGDRRAGRLSLRGARASPGATSTPQAPSAPTTSGSAPPRVATRGVEHAIASIAGKENPSYRLGTTATSALAISRARVWVGRSQIAALAASPKAMIALATRPSGRGLPATTSSTSSLQRIATASTSTRRPFSGLSALLMATMRPGTRALEKRWEECRVHPDRHDPRSAPGYAEVHGRYPPPRRRTRRGWG